MTNEVGNHRVECPEQSPAKSTQDTIRNLPFGMAGPKANTLLLLVQTHTYTFERQKKEDKYILCFDVEKAV